MEYSSKENKTFAEFEISKSRFFYGYIVVLAAFCIAFVMWGTCYTFGVFFEPLLREFDWTRAETSGAVSLSMLLSGSLSIVMGRLSDRFGPRIVATACGIFSGLGYLLMSQLNAIWQLYLFYGIVVSVGMSGAFVPLLSTIARWFVKRRGMMTGFVVAGIGAGAMIMVPVARWLISNYGWRTSYLIIGIISLVLITSAAQFLKREPSEMKQLPYGDSKEENLDLKIESFSFREIIYIRQLWQLCGVYFCVGLPIGTMLVHIVIYTTGLGISVITASNILATMGAVSIVGRITMGVAADRIGNKLSLIICFALLSVALFLFMVTKEAWILYLLAAIFGFAYGGTGSLMSLMTAELFGVSSLGAILGIIFTFDSTGAAVGSVVAGRIFDITNSYQLAFLVCSVMGVIGLMLVSLLKPIGKEIE